MSRTHALLIPTALALGATACRSTSTEAPRSPSAVHTATTAQAKPEKPATPPGPTLEELGVGTEWMNRTADPCTDFFEHACGGLVASVEIPGDRAAWGPGYELEERNENLLRATLESAAKDPGQDPVRQKLGAWWNACMDEPAIEKAGVAPLAPLMKIVNDVRDAKSAQAAVIALHQRGISAAFEVSSQQDFKDATLVIAGLDQGGLGLPDRDFYLGKDARTTEIRGKYLAHVERMFLLAGDDAKAAKKNAADVLALETALAKLAQDKVTRRDPYKVYHKIDRAGLKKTAKRFPWDSYFAALGFPAIQDVSVNSVEYFAGVDGLFAREKPATWKSYLRFRVLASQAGHLTKAFIEERFQMQQVLLGLKEIPPRWRRCVRSADGALGELLAQEYVRQRFDGDSKKTAELIAADVRAAMDRELDALPWMDDATRTAAKEKLVKMAQKIGFPDRWREYTFDVSPSAYAANELAAEMFELSRRLGKIGKPVDRGEWQMTPPTVNAYYDPSLNEMVFPAGILQPPYFSKSFSAAVNYGATGGTMGHELTHGFDDEGSQFDGAGNLRNWWSEATKKRFDAETKCVVDQYSGYEAVPGVKLNGELTAGENIADIGGVKLALSAFRAAQKRLGASKGAGGYTEDQLFFIGYAQSWCQKTRPELLETMAKTNPHSPERFRVNGVVSNVPEFGEAFKCQVGTPMRPAKTCAVW